MNAHATNRGHAVTDEQTERVECCAVCGHSWKNNDGALIEQTRAEAWSDIARWLAQVDVIEAVARQIAGLADNESWPSIEAFGGSPPERFADEFRDACHDSARETLIVLADLLAGDQP